MKHIDVNGVAVALAEAGAGEPVVLLHSSASSNRQWQAAFDALAGDHRVIAPDLYGYGMTGPWPAAAGPTLADETAMVDAVIAMTGGPVHLVGHSYGGSIAARTALRHRERVKSLTVIEPTLFHLLADAGEAEADREIRGVARRVVDRVERGDAEAAARGFIDYWVGPGAFDAMDPKVRSEVTQSMTKLTGEWQACFVAGQPTAADFAALTMPTLIVCAARTTLAARRTVEVLRRNLPNHDYGEIAAAGHMSPLTHPDRVNPMVEAHIVENS